MKFAQEVFRFLVVCALLAAGVWYVQSHDEKNWPQSFFHGSAASDRSIPLICGNQVDWSEDGKVLLIRYRGEYGFESRLALHELSPRGGRIPLASLGETTNATALAPDGRHVLVGTCEGRLWWIDAADAVTPEPIVVLATPHSFTAVAIADGGRLLAAGTNAGTIYLYDVSRQTSVELKTGAHPPAIASLAFSRDGERLLTTCHDGRLGVWSVAARERVQELTGHSGVATAGEFLSDGRRIVSAGLDDTVRIWAIDTGSELWRGDFGLLGVTTLAVSPDGRTAAWGGNAHRIIVWDLEHGCKRSQIDTSAPAIYDLKFSPEGTTLAAAGLEDRVRLYDMRTGQETRSIAVTSLNE